MLLIYGIALVYVIVIIMQFLKLKGQKSKKELILALFLTLVAMTYTFGYMLNWKLPTIDTMVTPMFDPLSEKIFGEHHNR